MAYTQRKNYIFICYSLQLIVESSNGDNYDNYETIGRICTSKANGSGDNSWTYNSSKHHTCNFKASIQARDI